jgi:TM2 domain-containing membrane protein YozV
MGSNQSYCGQKHDSTKESQQQLATQVQLEDEQTQVRPKRQPEEVVSDGKEDILTNGQAKKDAEVSDLKSAGTRQQEEAQMSTQTHMSYLPHSIYDTLPTMVRVELTKMSPERQVLFVEEFRRKKKNTGLAYLLWFVIGLHYVYLGKVGWQLFYWVTLGGLLIWMIIDLFRIPGMVRNYNKDTAMDAFRDLKMVTS